MLLQILKHRFSKLFLAIIVCGILTFVVDSSELLNILSQASLKYFLLLLCISVPMIWVSCLKWNTLLAAYGHKVSTLYLMRLYTMGYFFNTFMPSYVGGDLIRSYLLGKSVGDQADALSATVLERATGFVAMAILAACFLLFGASAAEGIEMAIFIIAIFAITFLLACFSKRIGNFVFAAIKRVLNFVPFWGIRTGLQKFFNKIDTALNLIRGNRNLLIVTMLYSLLFHCLTVINTYLAARAIGWHDVDVTKLFIVVPLVLLVSVLPLTPSGIGVQEGAFLFFLKRIGASSAHGLAVGLVLRAKVLIIALVGALLWVLSKDKLDVVKDKS